MNLPQGTACSYYNGFVVPVFTLGQIALAPRLANFRTWQPLTASLNRLFALCLICICSPYIKVCMSGDKLDPCEVNVTGEFDC